MNSIELFAGAGGLALGLEKAGFEHIALVEFNKNAADTLRLNRPKWNVIEEDIKKLAENNLTELFNIEKGELDLLSGGYPCQAFSYAGKKLGFEDTRGTMFYYYAEFIRQLMPKIFLVENVKGLVTHDKGKTLQTMIQVFEELGYQIQYQILNANDYKVAQKRQRMILIGIRKDLSDKIVFDYPNPIKPQLNLKDILMDCPISQGAAYSKARYEIMKQVPAGGNWRDLPPEVIKQYVRTSYEKKGGMTGTARRLSMEEQAPTILCYPIAKQTERCHPLEIRPLTIRESARIQSFPDNWEFCGSMAEQYKQIGNAVPINLAYNVGLELKKSLKKYNEYIQ